MINYRYNETKYAQAIESKGFITKYHVYELKILAKYYKFLGHKPKMRKELIYKFCEENIEEFTPVLYFRSINSVLSYASKKENKLIDIGEVIVNEEELKYIDSRSDLSLNEKKIMFCLLVMNKINKKVAFLMYEIKSIHNKFGGSNTKFSELFKTAKLVGKEKINEIVHSLYQKGYVHIDSVYRNDIGKIELHFIDNIGVSVAEDKEDEEVMAITTFDNIGYYYDKHIGNDKIINCEECETLIKVSSNRKKYCSECWKEVHKEQDREYQKRKYNSRLLENDEKPI